MDLAAMATAREIPRLYRLINSPAAKSAKIHEGKIKNGQIRNRQIFFSENVVSFVMTILCILAFLVTDCPRQ